MVSLKIRLISFLLFLCPLFSIAQNNALNFDGADDNIQVPHNNAFNLTSQYTIEALVKVNASNYSGNNTIVSKGDGNGVGVGADDETFMFQITGGILKLYMFQGPTSYWYSGNVAISPNTWTHVACTFDGGAQQLKFYINGVLDNTISTINQVPATNTQPLIIGRQGYDAGCACNYFNGDMDELRIWSSVQSACDINNNMTCTFPTTATNLVANYHFDEGVAFGNNTGLSTVSDAGAGNYTGTLTGFARTGVTSNWVTSGGAMSGGCQGRDIAVIGNSNTVNGDGSNVPTEFNHTDYALILPYTSVVRTYTVQNSGPGDLIVNDITISGTDASLFTRGSVSTMLPATIPSGGNMTFDVSFMPEDPGVKNAQINIDNNDCDESNFRFAIKGEGGYGGQALNFAGATRVEIPYDPTLTLSDGDFSVEFWARPSVVDGTNRWVIAKDEGNADLDYAVGIGTDNKWHFVSRNASINLAGGTVLTGTYYHVAAVLRGTNAYLYVNGTQVATTASIGTAGTNTSHVLIGARTAASPQEHFQGEIDEVRLWRRGLCVNEILAHKDCEIPTSGTNMVGNFHFSNGVAGGINYGINNLHNSAGGPHGTLFGFTYVGASGNWVLPGGVTQGNVCSAFSAPEIAIKGNVNVIPFDGTNSPITFDNTDFGTVLVSSTQDNTFSIENSGAATLTLTGSTTYVTITGSSDFSLFSDANSTVNAGGNTSFVIRFSPTSAGLKTAVVTVLNDDCDEAGYTFNIQGTGGTLAPGNVLRFDGANDYLETGYIPTEEEANHFTMECWVKGDAVPSSTNHNGPLYGNMMAIIWDHNDGGFRGGASVMDATNSYHTASFGTLNANTWYHLAATYDGTILKTYKDGVFQNQKTTGGGIKYNGTNSLKVGTHPNTALGFPCFAGSIEEVRIWSRVLSATEIASNRSCDLTGMQECLQVHYKFNQGAANGSNGSIPNVTDNSGKGRDGVFNNFALTGTTSNFSGGTPITGTCSPIMFPEADVKGNNIVITDGDITPSYSDSTDFGDVYVTGGVNVNTFTISNLGIGSTLTLNGTPKVTISGSSDFTLDADAGSGSLSSFMSTSFKIMFNPSFSGVQTAVITIMNSDCDEGIYTFTVQGKGVVPGSSLGFDGTDYISLANSVPDYNFDTANPFTVEFWFRTNSVTQQVIFSTLTNAAPYNGYEVYMQNGQLAFLMSSNFSGGQYLNISTNSGFNDNIWHHGAVVYNGISDASQIQLYVDELLQPVTVSHNGLINLILSSNIAHIGARGNAGQSFYFTGALDEIRIWNRALCSAELNSFNNCEISGTSTGLVGYYNFNAGFHGEDNTAYSTLTDLVGGNNTGTLNTFTLNGFASNWLDAGGVVTGTSCGTLLEPEIDVRGNGISITSGDATPATTDNTDFGEVTVGGNKSLGYRIFNIGTTTLNYRTNPEVVVTGSTDFSVILQPAQNFVGIGSSSVVTIRFSPSTAGVQTAQVYVSSDDCSEPDFSFMISGVGVPPPEIDVTQNPTAVPTGVNYDFGNYVINNPNSGKSFTINNLSAGGKLALNGTPKVELSLSDANQFAINITSLPDTIQPSSSADFNVQFLPTTVGNKTALLSIPNNDPDEAPYLIFVIGKGVVSGDLDSNGTISAGEVTGDTSGNGTIEYPSEVTGDINGNGSIGSGEVAGDNDGDGIINNGEIAGNTNGNGVIDNGEITGDANGNGTIDGNEFAGDNDGDGILDPTEIIGDVNGDGTIVAPEVEGDINGDGIADPDPAYVMVGKGTIVSNYISRYSVQPELPATVLPPYYSYAWVYSDTTLYMIKDTSRYFMDVVAHNHTNNGVLSCIIYRFGVPYDTLDFTITINRNYINIAELAELTSECAHVANPQNDCDESFIDYFKLSSINYDGNGCVRGGYQDLTGSGYTTDLEMGFTYTVELKPNKLLFFPNPLDPGKNDTTIIFYAVWIDYNNDGDFEDFAEYVKNGDSKSASTKLINITIANNELYEGSRRMRVGMKTGSGFSSSDACGINAIGSSGEIEDYLVTLVPMGALQAPNFLSPNNDGNNDLFSIKGVNMEKERILTVMNKTGAVVYQEEGYGDKELWGGKDNNGELLPKGTYYYIYKNGSEELKSFLEIDY